MSKKDEAGRQIQLTNEVNESICFEIDRIDALVAKDHKNHWETHRRNDERSVSLEAAGLAVVASRAANIRRAVLASIIEAEMNSVDISQIVQQRRIVVFANGTPNLLMREFIANVMGMEFFNLDRAKSSMMDYSDGDDPYAEFAEWPQLTNCITAIDKFCKINNERDVERAAQEGENEDWLSDLSPLRWYNSPVTLSAILAEINYCEAGATVIVETAHLIEEADDIRHAFTKMRNCAVKANVRLYLGVGMSACPVDLETVEEEISLSCLPEGYAPVVDIADKITLLVHSDETTHATIFDHKYANPYEGMPVVYRRRL